MIDHRLTYELSKFIKLKGMSICFKGGGAPDPPTSDMPDTENRKYARETLYPMVESGMAGTGYGTPEFNALKKKTAYSGLDSAFAEGKSGFESQMARTLDPGDTRVKNYLSSTLNREYVTKKDDLKRGFRSEAVAEKDMSMGMAADLLGGEKRMTVSGSEMYNNALQQNMLNQQRYGTFGTNVASGIGAGAASLVGAYQIDQKYAQQTG